MENNVTEYCFFFLEVISFAQWIYLHRALYQEYLNIRNLNYLFLLAKLFPVSSWMSGKILEWRLNQLGFDPSFWNLAYLATLKSLDTTKQSFCGWLYIYEVHTISFQTFFVWALLLVVHSWNSSTIRSNLLRQHYTCFTVPTTSARPHGSPLVWRCQWPS